MVAIGDDAQAMLGRTPPDICAVRPVHAGMVSDFEVSEALLVHLIRRVHGRNKWMSPRMVVTVPYGATDMERRAVRESCEAAGAREVHLLPRPLAAAIGAELPVHKPSGHMVVDIGGGATDVTLLSLSGVVVGHTVKGGGDGMDQSLIRLVRQRHGLEIGALSARGAREALDRSEGAHRVKGRCVQRGVPRMVQVTDDEIREAVAPSIATIAVAIRRTLEQAAPELASDVVDNGVVLTGACSRMSRIVDDLRDATGLAIVGADDPEDATIRGAGEVLESMDLLERMAS